MSRVQGERARMVRFVVGPDRTVVPDVLARLPGRGIWLSARRDVLETACKRGAFARAARGSVSVPPGLVGAVEAALHRRVVELLGLARRAGQAVSGFQKAREWVAAGRAGLVVQASDGSPEERARFVGGAKHIPVATPLAAAALGAVFGRDHAVHVVVSPGRLAEALRIDAERLAGVAGVTETAGVAGITKTTGVAGMTRVAGAAGETEAAGVAGRMNETPDGTAVRQGDGTSGR